MKVSIIIPAHNEEKYIRQTIEAALAQDYTDFEVIVVNNGSTDNTEKIASSFPQVKVVTENSLGTQFSRERGRIEAVGDIVANLDADTIPPSNWVSRAAKFFSDPEVVAVGGSVDYYDGSRTLRFFARIMQKGIYPLFHLLFQSLHVGGVLIASNAFTRANALERVGGYNTNILFYGDDTDTAKRLSRVGRVLYVPSIVAQSSARRFVRQGLVKTFYLYLVNFFWVTFFRKPFSKKAPKNETVKARN